MIVKQRLEYFFVLFFLLLAACDQPRHDPVPRTSEVLVLGDSISYGTGANKGEDFPSLLAGMTGWNVINAGVPGNTTGDGLERLPDLLEKHAPSLILVELGGNDFLRQLPQEQTTENLRKILDAIKARGIPAVLIAVPRPNLLGAAVGSLSDDPLFEQIGKETGTPVITDVLAGILAKNALKSDHIHPNADGYRELAEGLHDSLKEQGFLR